jgi:hypothetical protein
MKRERLIFLVMSMAILFLLGSLVLAQMASPAKGSYAVFNGRNSSLVLEAGELLDARFEDITIEAWVYLRSLPGEGEGWVIAAKPGSVQLLVAKPDYLFPDNSGFKPVVGIRWRGGVITSQWNIPLDRSRWYHISVSFDNPSCAERFSLNGEFYICERPAAPRAQDLVNPGSSLYIGGMEEEGSHLDGFIDEVRISSVVRYENDFEPAREALKVDHETLALWHFNKVTGFFTDSSGNGNTLTGKGVGFLSVEPAGRLSATWARIKSEY